MSSKAIHRTMLVWFSHHQSYILCFIMLVRNHGVESDQTIWLQSGKCSFYLWNQFRMSVYSNLQKSPPWKLKSPSKSGKSQNHPLGAISLPVKTTGLNYSLGHVYLSFTLTMDFSKLCKHCYRFIHASFHTL